MVRQPTSTEPSAFRLPLRQVLIVVRGMYLWKHYHQDACRVQELTDASTGDAELATFLAERQPFLVGGASWLGGEIRLAVSAYLSPDLPPRQFVSSARAIVLRGDKVLVQRSIEDEHVLPGGRLEAGESLEECVRREIP